jgi:hypothetical protein
VNRVAAPDPLETRKALKTLTDALAGLETQVADLTVRERELAAQNRGLLLRADDAIEKLAAAQRCCTEQTERNNELEPRAIDLARRLDEEIARADMAVADRERLAGKADAYDTLVGLTSKLLDAFNRLPLDPDDAHVIPSDVVPLIWLYGTYEWKSVADAKLALEKVIPQ